MKVSYHVDQLPVYNYYSVDNGFNLIGVPTVLGTLHHISYLLMVAMTTNNKK